MTDDVRTGKDTTALSSDFGDETLGRDFIGRLLGVMADAVIVTNRSGKIIFWNAASEKIYGWQAKEAHGRDLTGLFPRNPQSLIHQTDSALYANGHWRGDLTRITRSGQSVLVNCQRIVHLSSSDNATYVIEISRDNSTLYHQELVLRDTSRMLQAVMDNTSSYIHVRDLSGRFLYVNEQYRRVFGVKTDMIVGKSIEEIFPAKIAAIRRQMHETVIRDRVDVHAEIVESVDGLVSTYMDVKSPLFNDDGTVYAVYCIGTDISERKRLEASMAQLAHYDQVTQLPNRILFQDRLEQAVLKSKRTGKSLALLFLDLDAFKDVNDTLGHASGDHLLAEVGLRLRETVRTCDTVARLGGDEFTVVLEQLEHCGEIALVAQKILDSLLLPFEIYGSDIYISASIGITVSPRDAQDTTTLMTNADQAMYASKRTGPGKYSFYTESMNAEAASRVRIIGDLKLAIRDRQFRLWYQPIVSLKDGTTHKAEALIRWEHPSRGIINPVDFISIAEETGDIIAIGDWVFREATRQCAHWRTLFDPTFQISINTSPVQYRSHGVDVAAWKANLSAANLNGTAIVIEITEGLLMDANDAVRDQLHACSMLGIEIALDDFGTGYSSLSYLKKFDVDYLKIDRTFVTNLALGSNDLVLCEAIIAMAHKLGLRVIAEGIETELQRDLLMAAGCDFGQGYYFSKPVIPELIEQLIIRTTQ